MKETVTDLKDYFKNHFDADKLKQTC
jgi:hypothetical protein